jgi:hypothetical protein
MQRRFNREHKRKQDLKNRFKQMSLDDSDWGL